MMQTEKNARKTHPFIIKGKCLQLQIMNKNQINLKQACLIVVCIFLGSYNI